MKLMRSQNARHIDFGAFSGLIPESPNSCPSDIDMAWERRGMFLIAEWKRPTEKLSMGQKIMLKAQARLNTHLILLIIGDTDNEMYIEEFGRIMPNGVYVKRGQSTKELKDYMKKWWYWANTK